VKRILSLFLILFFCLHSFCFAFTDTLEFTTFFSAQNDTIITAIVIDIPANHYLYSNPKGPGLGRELQVSLIDSTNAEIVLAKQKTPQKILPEGEPDDQWVWAWKTESVIFLGFSPETQFPAKVKITGAYCHTSCIPFSQIVEILPDRGFFDEELNDIFANAQILPVEGLQLQQSFTPRAPPKNHTILSAILFAFLAGIILNFMPCVLPVVGIKILSFTENTSKKVAVLRSLAFSAGIIFVFLILALIAAQAKIWWGQQFQNPVFITVLAIFMIVGALILFDILTISTNSKLANLERKQNKNSLSGNFIRGICATILATPCSGPFLGAIMAWTLIHENSTAIFAVFLSVAVGMSAPYIVLSIVGGAKISQIVGKYSLLIKRILAVILLIFAGYLLFSANYGRFSNAQAHQDSSSEWQAFSQELFENALLNRQSVIVNFTAMWCLNCQYNNLTVYGTREIREILQRRNILGLTADLTSENLPAQRLKENLGARSIPFVAIFDGNDFSNPIVFYDIVSKRVIAETLENIK